MTRLVVWLALSIAGLVIVGALVVALVKALLGLLTYLLVGVLVVGAGLFLYRRVRRVIAPDLRRRLRARR